MARLLAQLCMHPSLNVVASTMPFWAACFEREINVTKALVDSGMQAQVMVGVMTCLSRSGMSRLHEDDLGTPEEYLQAVMSLRARIMELVRKTGQVAPLSLLRLVSSAFMVSLHKAIAKAHKAVAKASAITPTPISLTSLLSPSPITPTPVSLTSITLTLNKVVTS